MLLRNLFFLLSFLSLFSHVEEVFAHLMGIQNLQHSCLYISP